MTKQEFIEKLSEIDVDLGPLTEQKLTNEDYLTIEMVYTYHPVIGETNGKTQIAQIYAYGGMRVIKDMVPTAATARRIETQLRELKAQEYNLREELKRLKTGEEVQM